MEPLAAVTRNGYIESLHYGLVCVTDASGKVLFNLGSPKTRIFFRSSAKPIQALPLIHSGAAAALQFSAKETALACASHSGQPCHQEAVRSLLEKLGLGEEDLHCGLMTPYNLHEAERLVAAGENPNVLHCSCSGKHAAMLGLAKFRGYPLKGYTAPSHPVQREILETIALFAEEEPESIPLATDGCGTPIYLLPVEKIALSYAKLVQCSKDPDRTYHTACRTVYDSMVQHPEMVGGDQEFCTELMQAARGRLIGKVGCEAVYCLGIREGSLGVCIKIADGNERAVYPVVLQVLGELGVLDPGELAALKHWQGQELKNNHGEVIGRILAVMGLKKPRDTHGDLGKMLLIP